MTKQPSPANPDHPELPPPVEALAHAFALLGRRWSGLVLAALAKGPAGFGEVRERVPGRADRLGRGAPHGHSHWYWRYFPSRVMTTRSPAGSGTRLTSRRKLMALMMPSPHCSWISSLMVGP